MEFLKKVRAVLQVPFTIMAESKKARALVVGLIVLLAGKVGLGLSDVSVASGLALVGSYILGQGIADAGKEKAKMETAAALEAMDMLEVKVKALPSSSSDDAPPGVGFKA